MVPPDIPLVTVTDVVRDCALATITLLAPVAEVHLILVVTCVLIDGGGGNNGKGSAGGGTAAAVGPLTTCWTWLLAWFSTVLLFASKQTLIAADCCANPLFQHLLILRGFGF